MTDCQLYLLGYWQVARATFKPKLATVRLTIGRSYRKEVKELLNSNRSN